MRFALPAPTTGVVTAAALTTARPNGADPARAAGEGWQGIPAIKTGMRHPQGHQALRSLFVC